MGTLKQGLLKCKSIALSRGTIKEINAFAFYIYITLYISENTTSSFWKFVCINAQLANEMLDYS